MFLQPFLNSSVFINKQTPSQHNRIMGSTQVTSPQTIVHTDHGAPTRPLLLFQVKLQRFSNTADYKAAQSALKLRPGPYPCRQQQQADL